MSKLNKKIQLAWSLLCSGVTIDKQSNNVSLYNIIEEVHIPREELEEIGDDKNKNLGIPLFFNLFSVWRRVSGIGTINSDVKIEIIDPLGKKREAANRQIQFTEKSERFRLGIAWQGIKVSTSGIYTFKLLSKTEGEKSFSKSGETYLKVNIIEREKTETKKAVKTKIVK